MTTEVPKPTQEQAEVLHILEETGTHIWYEREFVRRLERAFDFKPDSLLEKEHANTGQFKGLEVDNVGANALVYGGSSWLLCDAIARKLGVATGSQMGRGSRQRATLANIAAYYGLT